MGVQIQGREYDFKYTDRRIEIIERTTGKPLMANLIQNQGMLSIADMRVAFVQGLKEIDSGHYIPQKMGEEAFKETLETVGYVPLMTMIYEALERDCGFFFQGL